MFKNHPKGLYVLFFANMGERFGFYTVFAIFTLYIQAKFGFDANAAGRIYGTFLWGVYFLPLIGGWISDNVGYGKTIFSGFILMILGYLLVAYPDTGKAFLYFGLGVISLGVGLFKGNVQALVGKIYDDDKFKSIRDSAFSLFYMGINVGAFFAPYAAEGISNLVLKKFGFIYNANVPGLAHSYLNSLNGGESFSKIDELTNIAKSTLTGYNFTSLEVFCNDYIQALSRSYNAGFAIAAVSIFISLLIFVFFRRHYKHADLTHKQKVKQSTENVVKLTPEEHRKRIIALVLIYIVVIFFWMSFHQNGFILNIFARDYTTTFVGKFTYILFDLPALLSFIAVIIGLILMINKSISRLYKMLGGGLVAIGAIIAFMRFTVFADTNSITPQVFQSFNPLFIVFLTPLVIGFFGWLAKRGNEPSSPKKIGIGMILTALGFLLMMIVSIGLISPAHYKDSVMSDSMRVSTYWLISTYLVLTFAELFISPIGISFVSKVAPPQLSGVMQGGWFAATSIGNLLAGFIGAFWNSWEMWQFFLLLVGASLVSAIFIFSIMKTLEKASIK